MARIGIFIDTLQGSLPSSFREKIALYIQTLPNIAFYTEEINLASSEGLDQMVRHLQSGRADGIVIIGGSPKLYETALHKLKHHLPINPYLFAVANVRGQALWTMKDEEIAMVKAWTLIDKAVRMVLHSNPIETQSLTLKPEVLVVGGGIVGISIALALARSGTHDCYRWGCCCGLGCTARCVLGTNERLIWKRTVLYCVKTWLRFIKWPTWKWWRCKVSTWKWKKAR